MTPIIIPVQQTREVNCIVQENIRYCEKIDLTREDIKYGAVFTVLIVLWIILIGNLMVDNNGFLALLLFLAPFLLVAIFI